MFACNSDIDNNNIASNNDADEDVHCDGDVDDDNDDVDDINKNGYSDDDEERTMMIMEPLL